MFNSPLRQLFKRFHIQSQLVHKPLLVITNREITSSYHEYTNQS